MGDTTRYLFLMHHMKQRVVKLCVRSVSLALVTLLLTSITTNAQQYSVSSPLSTMEAPSAMASVPQQINQIRLGANLPALTDNPLLQQAAQMHALDMITYGNWGHIGTDGSRVGDRINRIGYVVDGWAGENWVSAVNSTSALNWWMRSPAHRDNILSSAWQDFGVGSVVDPASGRTIYVAVFATGRQMVSNAPSLALQPSAAPQTTRVQQPTLSIGGPSPRTTTSTIKAGDTLFGLATQLRIPWTELASLNGWSQETILQLGQEFVIPTAAYAYIPITGSSSAKEFTEAYRVQPGDTLFTIAQDFQIDWPVIAHVNELDDPDMLQIGQRLLLPSSTEPVEPSVQPHIVESGDTVISIAAKYKVGWKTLLQINGLSESTILQIGQELRIANDGDF